MDARSNILFEYKPFIITTIWDHCELFEFTYKLQLFVFFFFFKIILLFYENKDNENENSCMCLVGIIMQCSTDT